MLQQHYRDHHKIDPLNIRYATDSTNMQLWNTHNPFRAVLICFILTAATRWMWPPMCFRMKRFRRSWPWQMTGASLSLMKRTACQQVFLVMR